MEVIMNWFESEQRIHEHVLRAEKLARHYPHVAHLVEAASSRQRTRRRINQALVSLGGLLISSGNYLQQRWAVELPTHTTPIANNR
jgi:hypothetical protein